jgi:hypothetical protein
MNADLILENTRPCTCHDPQKAGRAPTGIGPAPGPASVPGFGFGGGDSPALALRHVPIGHRERRVIGRRLREAVRQHQKAVAARIQACRDCRGLPALDDVAQAAIDFERDAAQQLLVLILALDPPPPQKGYHVPVYTPGRRTRVVRIGSTVFLADPFNPERFSKGQEEYLEGPLWVLTHYEAASVMDIDAIDPPAPRGRLARVDAS